MLTPDEKKLLVGVVTLMVVGVCLVILNHNDDKTVWDPDGLYVLAYASTPFLEDDLPGYTNSFSAETGLGVNVILTPDMDAALLRAVVDEMPIDSIMVPFDMREEFRSAGRIIELHTVLDEFPNPNFQTSMRWLWSSIDDQPICGFLIGEVADPTFSCIWYETQHVHETADLIRDLVVNTRVSESRLVQPNHFARKLLVEKDYAAVYNYLLHPSRRDAISLNHFILMASGASACPGGRNQDVRVVSREENIRPLVDPMTGVLYSTEGLVQYWVEYDCVQGQQRRRLAMPLIETKDYPLPNVFIPFANFDDWPGPQAYERMTR